MYKKIMTSIIVLNFILLNLIAWKVGVFSTIIQIPIVYSIKKLLINNYVFSIISGIACSIIAAAIIYVGQVSYSKRKLKEDFRCNECIKDIYDGIKDYNKYAMKIPKKKKYINGERTIEELKGEKMPYFEFYQEYKYDMSTANMELSDEKINLLIESIESCFFINLNFKLLGILNHIKNRLPNLRDGFIKIEKLEQKYNDTMEDQYVIKLGSEIEYYLIDVKLMVGYWQELLDYLKYQPSFIKEFMNNYNSKFKVENLTAQIINKQAAQIVREIRREKIRKRIKKILRR